MLFCQQIVMTTLKLTASSLAWEHCSSGHPAAGTWEQTGDYADPRYQTCCQAVTEREGAVVYPHLPDAALCLS